MSVLPPLGARMVAVSGPHKGRSYLVVATDGRDDLGLTFWDGPGFKWGYLRKDRAWWREASKNIRIKEVPRWKG